MPVIQHEKKSLFSQKIRHRFSLRRFLKGEGPETGPIHLVQRRVYILPTKRGIFFAVALFVMLIGSLNYNNNLGFTLTFLLASLSIVAINNLGFTLTFLLASLSIVAILHTYRNLLHLSVDVGHITPVFCGDLVRVPVILDNSNHPDRFSVRLDFPERPGLFIDIAANQWVRVERRTHATQSFPWQTSARTFHAPYNFSTGIV